MPKPKRRKPWSILWTDNSLLTYHLTDEDVIELRGAMAEGDKFAFVSIGVIRVEDIRHMVEYVPPKPPEEKLPDVPALPMMSEEELTEVLKVHYVDQPKEVLEAWLETLKNRDELLDAAEYAMGMRT